MFIADQWQTFEVIDTGNGEKLERWGKYMLCRPDPQVIWPQADPSAWDSAQARYYRSERGGGEWHFREHLPERWQISYKDLKFHVRPTGFKHTGLFPEQAANWDWMRGLIKQRDGQAKVLNLFAYTGGATVACAAQGAHVTHVDAAKGMVQWAKENRELSKIPETSCRFIVEDALAFDALLAQKVKSRLEWSEYYKCHNPMSLEKVADLVAPFDIRKVLQDFLILL